MTPPSKRFSIRMGISDWGMTAFVLVLAYSSILNSFIMAPKYVPLIDTVQDLLSKNDIRLIVKLGFGIDSTITVQLVNIACCVYKFFNFSV